MIAFTIQTFFHFFKLIPTTILLILLMDLFYRYNSLLHYATHLQIWKTAAFLWLLLLPIAMILTVIFSLSAILIKLLSKKDKYLKGIVEVSCSSIFLILFVLYGKEFLAKDWVFGNWIFAVILALPITIVIIYIIYTESFREKLNNVISIFWIPALVLFLISLIWIGPGNVNFRALYGEDNSSRLLELSEKTRSKGKNRPNIIMITFDALSAKDMSLYGYHRKTTPFWEELAKESYVFENMIASATFTQPAMLSVLTSKYPWTHGVYRKGALKEEHAKQSLPEKLKDYGYLNVQILGTASAVSLHPNNIGLSNQFDYFSIVQVPTQTGAFFEPIIITAKQIAVPVKKNIVELWLQGIYYEIQHSSINVLLSKSHRLKETPKANLTEALNVLKSLNNIPLFLWVHINPPHLPYWPPPPFKGTYLDESVHLNIQEHRVPDFHKFSPGEFKEKLKFADKLRARYDEMVLYTDTHLRSFVEGLKKIGMYENTILILTADHGETFEKGLACTHGSPHIYEPEVHIPLMIHLPAQQQGHIISTLAGSIDIAPTILDLLGESIPSCWEGESLLPYMIGDSSGTNKPKFSMQLEGNFNGQPIQTGTIAIYYGDYKMVRLLDSGNERLHRIKEDPLEKHNLVNKEPETVVLLRKLMNNMIPLPQPKKHKQQPTYTILSPNLAEEGYKGFNIISYGDKFYGLAQDEGAFDIKKVSRNEYHLCFVGNSVDKVKGIIDRLPVQETNFTTGQ